MNPIESFLDKEPGELETFLIAHARADVAPDGARERALLNVATALGAAGLSGAVAAYGSRAPVAKSIAWLIAKWVVVGMGTGLLGVAAADGVQSLTRSRSAEISQFPAAHAVRPSRTPSSRVDDLPVASDVPVVAAAPAPSAAVARRLAPAPGSTWLNDTPPEGQERSTFSDPRDERATSLTRELSILEHARAAVGAHSPARATQALDAYAREFPEGMLRAEAAALRVETVGELGDPRRALALAQAFFSSFPGSPLTARVRALSESYRANAR